MQIFFRSSKRKCGIKGSSSDELVDVKLSMVQPAFEKVVFISFMSRSRFVKLFLVGTSDDQCVGNFPVFFQNCRCRS